LNASFERSKILPFFDLGPAQNLPTVLVASTLKQQLRMISKGDEMMALPQNSGRQSN
jgi:hypothetical protein